MPSGKSPLLYARAVPVSLEGHRDSYVSPIPDFDFTARVNSLFLVSSELSVAAREFPVVFTLDPDGEVSLAVVLGLRADENLFVDAAGQWLAEYKPAYLRRYPFILARPSEHDSDYTVCIDEAYPGLNQSGEGQRLVTEEGKPSPLLEQAIDFLQKFQKEAQLTGEFCRFVHQQGLLDSVQANISLSTGQKLSLAGMHCVTEKRLQTLAPGILRDMLMNGYLDSIYRHMHSLANFDGLMRRLEQRVSTEKNRTEASEHD
jgi:hypothetical protein